MASLSNGDDHELEHDDGADGHDDGEDSHDDGESGHMMKMAVQSYSSQDDFIVGKWFDL